VESPGDNVEVTGTEEKEHGKGNGSYSERI
jgi:hypothetical protein